MSNESGERTKALDKFSAAVDVYRESRTGQPFIDRVEAAAS
jgi:hypothetical protein